MAIFERYWLQIFLQKQPNYFLGNNGNNGTFSVKLLWLILGHLLENIGLLSCYHMVTVIPTNLPPLVVYLIVQPEHTRLIDNQCLSLCVVLVSLRNGIFAFLPVYTLQFKPKLAMTVFET